MSLKRIALISAGNHVNKDTENANGATRPPVVATQGVNVVLGGAMMSGIIITVFLICYCCHRNQHKRQTNLSHYWRDPGLSSMEVYTVEGQQLYEFPPRVLQSGPPPPYDAVAHGFEDKAETDLEKVKGDEGLPSYETALRMAHDEGRVV